MSDDSLRILITATMSAGKSTLINALVGKSIARTSQEACTGNLCYIYNQPVENACENDLNQNADVDWSAPVKTNCYFRNQYCGQRKVCLIDTPGVNSTKHKIHGKITREAILNENYHVLICVLNANKIGTDDEIKHLKWISQNMPKDKKVIFVLNKLDDFDSSEDSIPQSIHNVETILKQTGYQNPVLCPISAYFGLLLKKKMYTEELSKIQQINYDLLAHKFQQLEYDLSVFYPNRKICADTYQENILYHRCGMAELENILFGKKTVKEDDDANFDKLMSEFENIQATLKEVQETERNFTKVPFSYSQKSTSKRKKKKLSKNKERRKSSMTKVFIKYNPYKVETEIEINGKPLKDSSKLKEKSRQGIRLQEWIDELPELLVKASDSRKFEITFHGIDQDFDDLYEILSKACQKKVITPDSKVIPVSAKEAKDLEAEIEKIFRLVQKGPFSELRSPQIIEAFQKFQSKDFEMCVVALMSAGKSTLINALLGEKLMPSSQQACTATITKIKDKDQKEWRYTAYEENEGDSLRQMETPNELLTFEKMQELNNSNVAKIEITGNIPFVSSKEMSLVITDTPGSNNAQDFRHGEVQRKYLNKNSKSLVLYVTEPTSFETDGDDALLKRVAENMASVGKQARDRFIFVLNKMDGRNIEEDGDISKTLDAARNFFKKHGIENPNLFPVSALSALNIRLAQNGTTNSDHIKKTISQVDILMSDGYSFEQYAPLPEGVKEEISERLEKARQEAQSADESFLKEEAEKLYGNELRTVLAYVELKKNGEEALIHSGIVSIEEAIRQYLEKYARPAKIYDFVQVFDKHFQALKYQANLEQELLSNQRNSERILRQIQSAEKKLNNIRSARQFENKMEKTVEGIKSDAKKTLNSYAKTYEVEVSDKTLTYRATKTKLEVEEAKEILNELGQFAENLLKKYRTALDELIQETLYQTCESLINEYKEKLSSAVEEIDSSLGSGISFNPMKLMSASILEINIEKMVQEERVKIGVEWKPNTHKKWYKPWTWFEEKGWWEDAFENVKYVQSDDLCQQIFSPIQKTMQQDKIAVLNYIAEESSRVSKAFVKEFHMLDKELNKKMNSLKEFASEHAEAKARLIETQKKLEWIQYIETRINQILEI